MAKDKITKDISIEDLIEQYPFSVKYLSDKGIRCIVCGEAIWGTLEEACEEKNFEKNVIEKFVEELNDLSRKFDLKVKNELKDIDTENFNE